MAKKTTMSQKIAAFVKANPGMTAAKVAEALGTKTQYVHTVMYLQRKQAKTAKVEVKPKVAKKRGRPAKVNPFTPIAQELQKRMQENVLQGRITQYAKLAEDRKKEIEELTVVIAYLEDRCSRAEARRGASV